MTASHCTGQALTRVGAIQEVWCHLLEWMAGNAYVLSHFDEVTIPQVDHVPLMRYTVLAHLKTLLKEFERC